MQLLTQERIQEMAESLSRTATSPAFLGMLKEIRAADPIATLETAHDAIAELKRTIPTPGGFRLTTRVFEPPQGPVVYFDENRGVGCVVYEDAVITVVDEARVSEDYSSAERGTPDHIHSVIREGIEEIGYFIATPAFHAFLEELYSLPKDEQPTLVSDVILDPEQRAKRGITVPDGMLIQRSKFADGRPTLFCVTKVLPLAYPWQKVTITFDSKE